MISTPFRLRFQAACTFHGLHLRDVALWLGISKDQAQRLDTSARIFKPDSTRRTSPTKPAIPFRRGFYPETSRDSDQEQIESPRQALCHLLACSPGWLFSKQCLSWEETALLPGWYYDFLCTCDGVDPNDAFDPGRLVRSIQDHTTGAIIDRLLLDPKATISKLLRSDVILSRDRLIRDPATELWRSRTWDELYSVYSRFFPHPAARLKRHSKYLSQAWTVLPAVRGASNGDPEIWNAIKPRDIPPTAWSSKTHRTRHTQDPEVVRLVDSFLSNLCVGEIAYAGAAADVVAREVLHAAWHIGRIGPDHSLISRAIQSTFISAIGRTVSLISVIRSVKMRTGVIVHKSPEPSSLCSYRTLQSLIQKYLTDPREMITEEFGTGVTDKRQFLLKIEPTSKKNKKSKQSSEDDRRRKQLGKVGIKRKRSEHIFKVSVVLSEQAID